MHKFKNIPSAIYGKCASPYFRGEQRRGGERDKKMIRLLAWMKCANAMSSSSWGCARSKTGLWIIAAIGDDGERAFEIFEGRGIVQGIYTEG